MEIDGCSINTEELGDLIMKKRVMFSLRLAEVATGQVVMSIFLTHQYNYFMMDIG